LRFAVHGERYGPLENRLTRASPVTPYALLKALHILLIVTWMGMDIGVFASTFWIRNSELSPETRLQIGRLAGLLDMGPRSSLILILAVGLLLTAMGGWGLEFGPATPALVGVAVALCLVWLWAVWQQHFALRTLAAGNVSLGKRLFFARAFRTIDLYLRIGLALVLIGIALVPTGIVHVAWLDWKVGLFGVLILAGVGIRMVADEFPVALAEIAHEGSTPQREARLDRSLRNAYPLVLGLWSVIVVMTVLAVAKPG
jgi:hypothetical protein